MSLLPSFLIDEDIEEELTKESESNNDLLEYGIDFETGRLTGEIVEGVEALKVWIWLALHCERYRHPIYSWDYGVELDQYIGQNYSNEYINAALKKDISETLMENSHIISVKSFATTFEKDNLTIDIVLDTDLGEVEMSV